MVAHRLVSLVQRRILLLVYDGGDRFNRRKPRGGGVLAVRPQRSGTPSLLHERVRGILIPPGELPIRSLQERVVLLGSDRVTVGRISGHIRGERVPVPSGWR